MQIAGRHPLHNLIIFTNLQFIADHRGDDNLCATEIAISQNPHWSRWWPVMQTTVQSPMSVIKVMTAELHCAGTAIVVTMDNRSDKCTPLSPFGVPLYPEQSPLSSLHIPRQCRTPCRLVIVHTAGTFRSKMARPRFLMISPFCSV